MDVQQFLAEFGSIANAPNGISQMRELVLVLAMQGKLIPQSSAATADELLVQVEEEKRKLIQTKVIRSPKPLPNLGRSDLLYSVPENWTWVRFGEISLHNSGKTLDSSRNSGLPRDYITTSNLYWGRFELSSVKKMLIREDELEKCTARKNDLLICEGGEAGRAAVWTSDHDVCFQNHVHRARFFGGINPFFAYRFFEKLNSTGEINVHRKGIGISNMSSKALAMIPFPLPPLEEQSRIVAKVDELMAVCDKLETQQLARRKLQNNLRQSTLQAVARATSPHKLQTTWERVADNFGRLFHAPEDVRMLRDVIFDLALRGALLSDVKHEDSAASLADDVVPLPQGWHWKTLAELSEYITSGSRGWKAYIASAGDSFIRSQDIKHDALIFENPAFVSLPVKAEGKRTLVRQGDLLLTITGGNVGKCATVPALTQDAYVSQHVALIRLREPWLAEFIHFWMINAFGGRHFLSRYIYGDKPGLNLTQVGSVLIPVPNQSACSAIMQRVRTYQAICEKLESQLRSKQEMAATLALASVSSLTGIVTEKAEEPMKAPQTELIAPLRSGTQPDVKAQAPLATILARHNGEMSAKDLWQRFGGEIDAFYAQLKAEVAHDWILEPAVAEMREKQSYTGSA
ncbi:restriction endonuclease subunit S [Polaromonas sp. UC242_47]|uniref:restriction endonuclease subunit S n=1 Tax=Polaromonas sp. UC242_47 TaxID=3374626 RepID=UPI00379673E3